MKNHLPQKPIRFIDLFAGIGGFRFAAEQVLAKHRIPAQCVFSSDIDPYARQAYSANFGHMPHGDITQVSAEEIPDHDVLFAGFPCQPFSIIGQGKGFEDTRGTLFFEIARILAAKRPPAFILENVKRLVGHNQGQTLKKILHVLRHELGYTVQYKVLNALDYGLPQKRERVFLVGFHKPMVYQWPPKYGRYIPLNDLLEDEVDPKYYASEYIRTKRQEEHTADITPSIWHENKAGHISSYPFSCALRAEASYNYLLVNGERRLTPREMLRLQGFPDSFQMVVSESQTRRQAGNAVPVNLVRAVFENLVPIILQDREPTLKGYAKPVYDTSHQLVLMERYEQLETPALAHG